jgi:hypothetical protein
MVDELTIAGLAPIIDRFRTMAIARASVLTGHVIASMIRALFGLVVVLVVALVLGFRPTAGPPRPGATRSPPSPGASASR